MLRVTPEPVAQAVYDGWRLSSFIHQPRVEPNNTGDVTIFAAMAFPPPDPGRRTFP